MQGIDPKLFVRTVKPLLERKDLPGLHTLLLSKFSPTEITSLLNCKCCDTRKIAALSLGLVGGSRCLANLAEQLRDPDPVINQMAEHAMWSIWFRGGGSPQANHHLHRGAKAIDRGELEHAIEHFDEALKINPDFAEAHNQKALALYELDRYEDALIDCQAAIDRMPLHFGAWASKGHCHAHLGHFAKASRCYQKALAINPHMEQVQQVVDELNSRACGGEDTAKSQIQ